MTMRPVLLLDVVGLTPPLLKHMPRLRGLTPRPVYHADGRKFPDCYVRPRALHDELTAELGTFPLFHYWGPTASIVSSRWIVAAARRVLRRHGIPGPVDVTSLRRRRPPGLVTARAGLNLLRKKAGQRYAMRTTPLQPSCVHGTHGRRPDTRADGPVLLCSDDVPWVVPEWVEATAVRDLVLALQGLPAPAR